ncbi:hypothetical protein [Flavobacterium sp.]|uniref:hypothetical protein n=1 Tax=Flavobacterium sp. TaxID=239 RepID=UPI0026281037|nr:hypothetical protein [Flavobacterium sp.]
MSHLSQVIVIVVPPSDMKCVFDRMDTVLRKHHFEFEEEPFESIILSDIETDDGNDYVYESESIDPESKLEREAAIEKLRNHRTGGLVNYRGIEEKFDGLAPYDVGVSFDSLDNQTIEYMVITTRDYIYDPHAAVFENIIATILDSMVVIGIANGKDYPYEWSEAEVAQLIKKGELEGTHPRLCYKRS